MAVTVEELRALATLDDSRFQQGMKDVDRTIDRFERKMREVFQRLERIGKMSAIGLAAMTGALFGVTNKAAKLEDSLMRLETVTLNNSKAFRTLEKAAQRLNKTSAENIASIRNVMASAYQLGSQLGLTADQVAEIVTVGEAYSTVWGESFQSTTESFLFAIAGMTRRVQSLGIVMNEAILQQWLYDQGIRKSIKSLSEAELYQYRYQFLLDQTTKVMERSDVAARTLSNTWARLKNSAMELLGRAGLGMFETIKDTLWKAIDIIERAARSEALPALMSNLFELGMMLAAIGITLGIVGKIGSLSLGLLSIASWALQHPFVMLSAVILAVIGSLDKLKVALNLDIDWDKSGTEQITAAWEDLKAALDEGNYMHAIGASIRIVIGALTWVWEKITGTYDKVKQAIGEDIDKNWTDLKTAWEEKNYGEIFSNIGKLTANLLWGGILFLGHFVDSLLESVKKKIAEELFGDAAFATNDEGEKVLNVGWWDIVSTGFVRIARFIWGIPKWTAEKIQPIMQTVKEIAAEKVFGEAAFRTVEDTGGTSYRVLDVGWWDIFSSGAVRVIDWFWKPVEWVTSKIAGLFGKVKAKAIEKMLEDGRIQTTDIEEGENLEIDVGVMQVLAFGAAEVGRWLWSKIEYVGAKIADTVFFQNLRTTILTALYTEDEISTDESGRIVVTDFKPLDFVFRAAAHVWNTVWSSIKWVGGKIASLEFVQNIRDEIITALFTEDEISTDEEGRPQVNANVFEIAGRAILHIAGWVWSGIKWIGEKIASLEFVQNIRKELINALFSEEEITLDENGRPQVDANVFEITGRALLHIGGWVWSGFKWVGEKIASLEFIRNLRDTIIQALFAEEEITMDEEGRPQVDANFLEIAGRAIGRVGKWTWDGMIFTAEAIADGINALANKAREHFGIDEKNRLEINLGTDLKIIAAGALELIEPAITFSADVLTRVNEELSKITLALRGEFSSAEEDAALHETAKEAGKALGELVKQGFVLTFRLVDVLSAAVESAITELTGSETLGMVAGKAVPIWFTLKLLGASGITSGFTNALLTAGLIRYGALGMLGKAAVAAAWALPVFIVAAGLLAFKDQIKAAFEDIKLTWNRLFGTELPTDAYRPESLAEQSAKAIRHNKIAQSAEMAGWTNYEAFSDVDEYLRSVFAPLEYTFQNMSPTDRDIAPFFDVNSLSNIQRELMNVAKSFEELEASLEGIEAIYGAATAERYKDALELFDTLTGIVALMSEFHRAGNAAEFRKLWRDMLNVYKLMGFAEGGFTSGGTQDVAGIVHGGEWVAPAWLVKHPSYGKTIAALENVRTRGYASGGFVGSGFQVLNADTGFLDKLLDYMQEFGSVALTIFGTILEVVVDTASALLAGVAKLLEAVGTDTSIVYQVVDVLEGTKSLINSLKYNWEQLAQDITNPKIEIDEEDIVEAIDSSRSLSAFARSVENFFQKVITKLEDLKSEKTQELLETSMESVRQVDKGLQKIKEALRFQITRDNEGNLEFILPNIQLLAEGATIAAEGLATLFGALAAIHPLLAVIVGALLVLGTAIAGLITLTLKVADAFEGFKSGLRETTSGVRDRLRRPFEDLGRLVGRRLIPVFELLIPVIDFVIKVALWFGNAIILMINGIIALLNKIPGINIELVKPIAFDEYEEERRQREEEEGRTVAGWNQPVTNNWNVTFTGNTVLDSDDDSLRIFWDKLIKYAKEHDMEIVIR